MTPARIAQVGLAIGCGLTAAGSIAAFFIGDPVRAACLLVGGAATVLLALPFARDESAP